LQCAAVCCSVLQCVAVCCSALQCVAVCCSMLQCVAVCCSASIILHAEITTDRLFQFCCSFAKMLQCVALCCKELQYIAVCCSVLQCVAVRYSLSIVIHTGITTEKFLKMLSVE